MARTAQPLYQRLVALTAEPENGQACWVHSGSLNKPNGYPQVNINVAGKVKHFYAHRLMWSEFHGPIPEGHEVDHSCHNHRCVNIDHLQLLPISHNRAKNQHHPDYQASRKP